MKYNAEMAASGAAVAARNAGKVAAAAVQENAAKSYYSQLPYMLGEDKVMKFSLIPKQETCGLFSGSCCVPGPDVFNFDSWHIKRSKALAKYLQNCDAVFDLQLQVADLTDEMRQTAEKSADASWSQTPVTVGRLTIPKQNSVPETAVGEALRDRIASALSVDADGVDKMFAFHPIMTHEANRPVGDINAFRAGFYSQNAVTRWSSMHKDVFKAKDGKPLTAVQTMPFEALSSSVDALIAPVEV